MDEPVAVLRDVAVNLKELEIEYFLVGPFATHPPQQKNLIRITNNINIVLNLELTRAKDFLNRFVLDGYTCPSFELLYDHVKEQGSFSITHEKSKVKIKFEIRKSSDIAISEFARKTLIDVEPEFSVYVSTVEDVILKKLEFYNIAPSPQYISDVRRLIYHNEVDQDYLNTWIDKLALSIAWERASKN